MSGYEEFPDDAINDDGDLVHLAFFGEVEPVKYEDTVKDPR